MTAFLVVFEIAFFTLYLKMQYAGKVEIWFLQIIIVTAYAITIFLTAHSRFARLLYFLFGTVLCAIGLGFTAWLTGFTSLKIILGTSLAFSLMGLVITIKTKGVAFDKVKRRSILLIGILASSSLLGSGFMAFSPQYIEIDPDSYPNTIFWCGTLQLPNTTERLEMSAKYNIGYAATIRNTSVGNAQYMALYKKVISYKINLYLAIGLDSFYTHIGNAHQLPSTYKNIRDWFDAEGILNSSYIKGFAVDAETPQYYVEQIESLGPADAINYLTDNFPTDDEIEESEKGLQEFTAAVRADGKQAGIVRAARIMEEADGDDDFNLLTRNIYGLDVTWDFSVTMLYRTNRAHGIHDEESANVDLFTSFAELFMGTLVEGVKYTVSEYSFYQNVALEQTPGEIDVPVERQYIFVGNFKSEFADTTYIKDKEFFKDIDICRHFDEDEIWMYSLGGFKYHYGWEGIKELGIYLQQDAKWWMEYESDDAIMIILLYGVFMMLDMVAFMEEDAS